MTTRIDIKRDLLTWAIERAGLVVDEFLVSYPKAQTWLDGEKQPTLKQLEDFANKVHVPFGYLLLEKPPEEKPLIPFFRTNGGEARTIPLVIRDTVSTLKARQDWLADYLQESGSDELPFVNRFTTAVSVDEFVGDIREVLGLAEGWARAYPNWTAALGGLTDAIEETGVVVTFNGVAGNSTSRPLPVASCRGFVLVDRFVPFLFVNNRDAKSAQMFTLVHELAHIWLGESAGFDLARIMPADDPVEKLCDAVAAEFLVPETSMVREWADCPDPEQLARIFKVSPIVIGRRALDLGFWSRESFFAFYEAYTARVRLLKEEKNAGGGNFYATARKRLSPRFMGYVNRAVLENKLPFQKAYQITGLKGATYRTFMRENFGTDA